MRRTQRLVVDSVFINHVLSASAFIRVPGKSVAPMSSWSKSCGSSHHFVLQDGSRKMRQNVEAPVGTEAARTGRELQRYEHGYRLVAGCIPYQLKENSELEILMVSSQNGRGLVFPKGGWETDETARDAACREAIEEAGVRGLIKGELGFWTFTSKRQLENVNPEGFCKAYMFALEVTQELETWPEQQVRQRKWFTVATAIELCRHAWMREALEKCYQYLQKLHLEQTCYKSTDDDDDDDK